MPNEIKSVTMFELAEEFRELAARLYDTDQEEQAIIDTLEGAQYPMEQKAKAISFVLRAAQIDIDAHAAELKRLDDRKTALEAHKDRLMAYVHAAMMKADIKKLPAGSYTFTSKKNPPKVEITDQAALPVQFLSFPEIPPPTPDKKAIAAALKAGEPVPGAREGMPTYRLEWK